MSRMSKLLSSPAYTRLTSTPFVVMTLATILLIGLFIFIQDNPLFRSTLVLNVDDPDVRIIIDTEARGDYTQENGSLTFTDIEPGERLVSIIRDGYWPWVHVLNASHGETYERTPFFTRKSNVLTTIPDTAPEYWQARRQLLQTSAPTQENPRTSADGLTDAWTANNTLVLKWNSTTTAPVDAFCDGETCDSIKTITRPARAVSNLLFYPERNDVLVYVTGHEVYAVGIHGLNFHPIFAGGRGDTPRIAYKSTSTLYILNNDELFVTRLQ